MYSRKPSERDLLHRLSHINDIQKQTTLLSKDVKDARMESMSMQEVIARYMQCAMAEQIPQTKGNKQMSYSKKEVEKVGHEAQVIVEVCQISNQRKEDARERTKEKREQEKRSPGVPVGKLAGMEDEIVLPQTAYDMLDVNRCAGFLLYSYDKHGTHSILGEDNKPGNYGGRLTNGKFGRKA